MLHTCVSGSNLHTQQSHYLLSLADLSTDYEPFLTVGNVKSFEPPPIHNVMGDFGNLLTVAEGEDFSAFRRNIKSTINLTAVVLCCCLQHVIYSVPRKMSWLICHELSRVIFHPKIKKQNRKCLFLRPITMFASFCTFYPSRINVGWKLF